MLDEFEENDNDAPARSSVDLNEDGDTKGRAETVDLEDSGSLIVDISDAMSEREKVIFTVHTKTNLTAFQKREFQVTRQHDEFLWLHDVLEDTEEYAGIIVPPAPPRPDFDASREKLQKLGEGEGTMTKEEFAKTKAELEAEYLATFKKTVAMHEVFLQRLAAHPRLRNDVSFKIFLEFEQDLMVRGKNKRERVTGFLRTMTKTVDESLLLSNQKDEDESMTREKTFLVSYHSHLKEATAKADRMTRQRRLVADSYLKISMALSQLTTVEQTDLHSGKWPRWDTGAVEIVPRPEHESRLFTKMSEYFEKARKLEARISTDEDLKLSDTLRYYMNDSAAAKNLLYRRSRALADYENSNKALEKARNKNKDVRQAEDAQEKSYNRFVSITESARDELKNFRGRRIAYFKKNLKDLAELELKHARAQAQLLNSAISTLQEST